MITMETAIFPALIAFVMQLILCPILIPMLHRLKFGQYIREEGPKSHQKKAGTPTMGGIAIMLSLIVGCVFFAGKFFDFCFSAFKYVSIVNGRNTA